VIIEVKTNKKHICTYLQNKQQIQL